MKAEEYGYQPDKKPQQDESVLDQIDFNKLKLIISQNIIWLLLIFLVALVGSFIYLRYTKPLYESSSLLKLDIKKEASILGLETNQNTQTNNLSGEIELIKSNLFFSKVINAVDLDVSVYAYGRVINSERYRNPPFTVDYKIKDERVYDRPFDVNIINENEYELNYEWGSHEYSKRHRFGNQVSTSDFVFTIHKTRHFKSNLTGSTNYYFTINSERNLTGYLQNNMSVKPVNYQANTIRVSFKDFNRYKARDLVKAIDSVYLKYTKEKKSQATEQKIEFINNQLSQTEKKLDKYEDYFENFTITHRATNLESEIGNTISKIKELERRKQELSMARQQVNELQDQVIQENEVVFKEYNINTKLPEGLKSKLNKLDNLIHERELMLTAYKKNTYAVERKNQQISLIKNDILQSLSSYKNHVTNSLDSVKNSINKVQENFSSLPSQSTQYDKNQRYYSLYENFYLSLMKKKNEMEISKAGTVTDFVILSPANIPHQPISPKSSMIYGAGVAGGFLISLLFLALKFVLDNKVNNSHDFERQTSVPIISSIPFYKKLHDSTVQLYVDNNSHSLMAEAFRSFRTNLQFMMNGNKSSVITVTSTIGGEGKTFVSVNLSSVLAISKARAIIVDADLRKPKVHQAFNTELQDKGLSTYLINKYSMEECIFNTSVAELDYLPAGTLPPNPSELLLSNEFDQLLAQLKETYSYIIIDTPPVGLVTDGMLCMKKSDLSVYVMRAGYSKTSFIKKVHQLRDEQKLKNLAIVLNAIDPGQNKGHGYSYYGYGYYADTPGKISRIKNMFSGKKSKNA